MTSLMDRGTYAFEHILFAGVTEQGLKKLVGRKVGLEINRPTR